MRRARAPRSRAGRGRWRGSTVRQTAVDRNILRLAAAEILFGVSDAPPGAVVNEAVELAKKYSTADSGRFVNGVLGTLVREVEARRGTWWVFFVEL